MGAFIPSTQRHYHRLILLLILPHVSVTRPSSSGNVLLARITVACVRSGDGGFSIPSMQRHYHRLILLLILPHVSVTRPSSSGNIINYIIKTILVLGFCILSRV
jgi:hypothetical protein